MQRTVYGMFHQQSVVATDWSLGKGWGLQCAKLPRRDGKGAQGHGIRFFSSTGWQNGQVWHTGKRCAANFCTQPEGSKISRWRATTVVLQMAQINDGNVDAFHPTSKSGYPSWISCHIKKYNIYKFLDLVCEHWGDRQQQNLPKGHSN